jgi:hypothetical protein
MLLACDGKIYTVDVNGKATNFHMVVIKSYHREELTKTLINNNNKGSNTKNMVNDSWIPSEPQPTRRKRKCSFSSKNKSQTMDINTMIITSTMMITVCLSAREQANYKLSLYIRKEDKITTAGAPFELLDKKEVDALIN